MTKVEIRVDDERLKEFVTIDDFIAYQEGKIRGMKNVIAHFVIGADGQYMEYEKALKLIGSLTITQLLNVSSKFSLASEVAVGADPKAPKESTEPILPT